MVVPGTTVFHGDLYPPNVHQKLPMGTGIREKLRQKLDSLLPHTNFTRSSCQTSQRVNHMPRRKTYSNREKLHILDGIDKLFQSGEEHSFQACCRAVGIQPGQARQ